MTTLVLNDAELYVELNRLICAALDTRRKLLACSLRGGTQLIGFIARSSASALAVAAHELADLVHRLGGRPATEARREEAVALPVPSVVQEQDPLQTCEHAIAEVACEYRDTLEWNLPEPAQEVLMRQFSILIANYEHVKALRERLQRAGSRRNSGAVQESSEPPHA
ncbi:MAG: hypothetical protein KIS79_04245 [Burkholderiales bacterium]|nr:hypothetical protein [Burkholderiales bacterium]